MPMQPASTNKMLTAGGRAADPGPRRPGHHHGRRRRSDPPARRGGARRRRRPDAVGGARPAQDTWYRGAARISDLADQVRRSGITVTAVQVDISRCSAARRWRPGWDPRGHRRRRHRPDGVGDARRRSHPADHATSRAARRRPRWTPVARWPSRCASTRPPSRSPPGPPTGAASWRRCSPPPLIERLRQMMNVSDNVMAESHRAARWPRPRGRPQSFAGAVDAVLSKLAVGRDRHDGRDAGGLQRAVGRRPADRRDARRGGQCRGRATTSRACVRWSTCCRSPAAAAPCRTASSAPTPGAASAGWLRAKTGSLTGHQLAGRDRHRRQRPGADLRASSPTTPGRRAARRIDALAATLRSCGCGA